MLRRTLAFVLFAAAGSALLFAQDQATTAPSAGGATYAERLREAASALEAARQATDVATRSRLYQQVLDSLTRLTNEDPRNIDARLLHGELLLDVNQWGQAQKRFQGVLRDDPYNFRALLGTGRVHVAQRTYRSAVEHLRKALEVAPAAQRAEVLRLLSAAYDGVGDFERAIEMANQAAALAPDDLPTLQLLVKLHRDRTRYDLANDYAKRLVEQSIRSWQKAPESLTRLQTLDAAYDLQLSVLGYKRREGMLQKFFERNSKGEYTDKVRAGQEKAAAAVLNQIAELIYRQGNVKRLLYIHEALQQQGESANYDPENITYARAQARMLVDIGDLKGAAAVYGRIRAAAPDDPDAAEFFARYQPTTQPAGPSDSPEGAPRP